MSDRRYTQTPLARELVVSEKKVYAVADEMGIPYSERHGVDKNGKPIVRRVYLRTCVDARLDQIGREPRRGAA